VSKAPAASAGFNACMLLPAALKVPLI